MFHLPGFSPLNFINSYDFKLKSGLKICIHLVLNSYFILFGNVFIGDNFKHKLIGLCLFDYKFL